MNQLQSVMKSLRQAGNPNQAVGARAAHAAAEGEDSQVAMITMRPGIP